MDRLIDVDQLDGGRSGSVIHVLTVDSAHDSNYFDVDLSGAVDTCGGPDTFGIGRSLVRSLIRQLLT
jgi:hypothetical protein